LVVFAITYYLIKTFLRREYMLKELELRTHNQKEVIPIRLQAYERLSLFLERINFNNLIQRVRAPGMSAKDLQISLISNIRQEFEHNMSQQVYVSSDSWDVINICKDEMVKIVNLVSASLPEEASGDDLSRALFDYLIKSEQVLPTQRALNTLKEEARNIFFN